MQADILDTVDLLYEPTSLLRLYQQEAGYKKRITPFTLAGLKTKDECGSCPAVVEQAIIEHLIRDWNDNELITKVE